MRPETSGINAEIKTPRRWQAWARSLTGRFGRRPLRQGGASQVLRRPPVSMHHQQLALSFAPRLAFTLEQRFSRHHHAAAAPAVAVRPAVPPLVLALRRTHTPQALVAPRVGRAPAARPGAVGALRRPAAVDTPNLPPSHNTVTTVRHERTLARATTITERVLRQTRRIEERRLVEVRPVLHKPAALSPTARAAGVSAPAPMPNLPSPTTHGFPAAAPRPVDVSSLADQVMRQIDHRMQAWRERTGRV